MSETAKTEIEATSEPAKRMTEERKAGIRTCLATAMAGISDDERRWTPYAQWAFVANDLAAELAAVEADRAEARDTISVLEADLRACTEACEKQAARLAQIQAGAEADAKDLEEMRDGTKLTRSGLVSCIVYAQQDIKELKAHCTRLCGKIAERDKQIEAMREEVAKVNGWYREAIDKIFKVYQITGPIAGGSEIESAKRQAATIARLEGERDRLQEAANAVLTDEWFNDETLKGTCPFTNVGCESLSKLLAAARSLTTEPFTPDAGNGLGGYAAWSQCGKPRCEQPATHVGWCGLARVYACGDHVKELTDTTPLPTQDGGTER